VKPGKGRVGCLGGGGAADGGTSNKGEVGDGHRKATLKKTSCSDQTGENKVSEKTRGRNCVYARGEGGLQAAARLEKMDRKKGLYGEKNGKSKEKTKTK